MNPLPDTLEADEPGILKHALVTEESGPLKECSSCKAPKTASHFIGKTGNPVKTCLRCREGREKFRKENPIQQKTAYCKECKRPFLRNFNSGKTYCSPECKKGRVGGAYKPEPVVHDPWGSGILNDARIHGGMR